MLWLMVIVVGLVSYGLYIIASRNTKAKKTVRSRIYNQILAEKGKIPTEEEIDRIVLQELLHR